MILTLKPNAAKIPTDVYGAPCPDAVAADVLTTIDKKNKLLIVQYCIWRNKAEMEANAQPLQQGAYTWTANEVPAIYEPEIEAIEAVPAVLDENGEIITPEVIAVPGKPAVLLVPKFGAFDTIFQNITIDNQGNTVFGGVGEQWLLLAINPYGDAWGINWQIEK